MPAIKTAISIEKDLFEQAEELAKEMKVSRSKFVSMALKEFVRRHEEEELTRKINEVYADFPDEQEKDALRFSNASIANLLEDDEW
jgi:metal-responsive CopG/Arc/MetJ family transcriptional regulator